jgi:hypothetical protein
MNEKQTALCAIGIVAIGIAIYYANSQTSGNDTTGVPAVQGEGELMGMGVAAGLRLNAGTPLDMTPSVHFWAPGQNQRDANSPQPVVQSRHRYPLVPGGNVSTVMHRGWSAFTEGAPADNDWRINPPEVAVI